MWGLSKQMFRLKKYFQNSKSRRTHDIDLVNWSSNVKTTSNQAKEQHPAAYVHQLIVKAKLK